MARYIDADKTVRSVSNNDKYGKITKEVFVSLLQNADTADVAPVTHAHWNYLGEFDVEGNFIFRCSNCHAVEIKSNLTPINYCWYCGAKMDEEVDA